MVSFVSLLINIEKINFLSRLVSNRVAGHLWLREFPQVTLYTWPSVILLNENEY